MYWVAWPLNTALSANLPERRPAHLVLHPDVHRRSPSSLVNRVDRRAQDERPDRAGVSSHVSIRGSS